MRICAELADPAPKQCLSGTHRTCRPEQTFRRVGPLLPSLGITRVADLTWLDDTGVHVFQAVRPNSYSLSVSQGKGMSAAHARVSAVMESIETWHAETVGPPDRVATGDEIGDLGYELDELFLAPRNYRNPAARIEWIAAETAAGDATYVPRQLISLDFRVAPTWEPPLFVPTSNGLASGNSHVEAALHGILEVIERDACARGRASSAELDLESVTGPPAGLIMKIRSSGKDVRAFYVPSPAGIPCFRALLSSADYPAIFGGSGCHPDRDVALCRALTEAVQSRVTEIAGARDDIEIPRYDLSAGRPGATGGRPPVIPISNGQRLRYAEIAGCASSDLGTDLRAAVARVRACTGREPLFVVHTRAELGVPVVTAVCPRMTFTGEKSAW
jgi:ribosomal protein S12 methylthiotransferase accessory factor